MHVPQYEPSYEISEADVEASADTNAPQLTADPAALYNADVEALADTNAPLFTADPAALEKFPLMSEVEAHADSKVIEVTSFLSETRILYALKGFVVTNVVNNLL